MTASIFAPIKINIALHVGPPQTDGYHPVDTLCVFPAIGDVVSYDPDGEPGIDFAGPFGASLSAEPPQRNLVWRAFRLLGIAPEGRFLLVKQTPIASGVGAGTADGAAAMLLLNAVLDLGFSADALIARSLGLGADGPVCMAGQIAGGGLWRATGIGERVVSLGAIEPQGIVVANPGIPVPTGQVFRRFDASEPGPLTAAAARRGAPLPGLVRGTRNDLEAPATAIAPAIGRLKQALAGHPGARAVRMSGSGATCYALHASEASAERSARRLRAMGIWAEASVLLGGRG